MVVDLTVFNFLMPIIIFVLAFLIVYAILRTSKLLGGISAIDVIVSLIIAIIFSTVSSARDYIQTVAPWFVILIVALFFALFIMSFISGKFIGPKWIGIVALILLALVFIFSAFKVLNINSYIPDNNEQGKSVFLDFIQWILKDTVLGAILLVIIAGIVVWVVVKG